MNFIAALFVKYYMEKTFEIHPFKPFIPERAKVLIMGTFPPPSTRWSMNFYYPNRTNDFWYMMGLIFYGDRNALLVPGTKNFDLPKIKNLLAEKGIAMNDTGWKIHRQKGNASDKFLEILEPVNLSSLLDRMPLCRAIATTGEKAAQVVAALTDTLPPKIGVPTTTRDGKIQIWRMPSTSRAYPLKLELKAKAYSKMFETVL